MTPPVRELTPSGRGGVSVLEVRGSDGAARLARLAPRLPEPGRFAVVSLSESGELLDEVLLLRLAADRFEVHATGSPPLVRRLVALLGGAEPEAEPATVEARAARLLPDAPCEAAARLLLDQARGALRAALEARAADPPERFAAFAHELREAGRVAELLLRPPEVVLAGPVNAGKSTLFNALLGEERALVAEEPGTTRDALVAEALLGEYPVRLIDTAGERDVSPDDRGRVELLGQAAGRSRRSAAHLVLWLSPADADDPGCPEPDERTAVLHSRADRAPGELRGPRVAAAVDPEGARRTVAELYRSRLRLPPDPWRPGAPVPFEPGLASALAGLWDRAGPAERLASIERLIGARDVEGRGGSG